MLEFLQQIQSHPMPQECNISYNFIAGPSEVISLYRSLFSLVLYSVKILVRIINININIKSTHKVKKSA